MSELFFFIFLFIILRFPSFFEPHWYGDEGIYAAVSLALEKGAVLYRDVFDNRLPFIYYLFSLGNSSNRLVFVRFVNVAFGIFTIVFFYLLLKKLKIKKIFLGIFILTSLLGLPILETNVSHNEVFFLPFVILGLYFSLIRTKNFWFLAGFLFGLAFIVKYQAFFSFFALIFYLLFFEDWQKNLKKIIFLFFGFFTVVFLLIIFFLWQGSLLDAFQSTILNNISYTKFFISAGIPFSFRLFFLFFQLFFVWIFFKKKIFLEKEELFFLLLIFDLWAGIFPGRRYFHYLIQAIPSFSLVWANIFDEKIRKSFWLKFLLLFFIIILNLKIFSLGAGPTVFIQPKDYYFGFFDYLLNKKPKVNLPFTFGKENQLILELQKNSSLFAGKKVFFYADLSWAYDLFQIPPRNFFVTFYHINIVFEGRKRLLKELKEKPPEVLIVEKKEKVLPEVNEFLTKNYQLIGERKYFYFFSRK